MAVRIPLSRGQFALVDEADIQLIAGIKWCAKPIQRRSGGYYAYASKGQRTVYMHRVIMDAGHDSHIDHINGDGLDNRRANLRVASISLNNANSRRPINKVGLRGVYEERRNGRICRFRACVGRGATKFNGPSRGSAIHAAFDYDKEALRRFGEFAHLNFPCALPKESGK